MHFFQKWLGLWAVMLCLAASASADEAASKGLLEQTLSYWQQGDLDAIVSLFQENVEQATLAIGNAHVLVRSSTASDGDIKSVVFAANVLARVGDLSNRSGTGGSFGQLLAPNLMLVDSSAWNGTALAGPGASLDLQYAQEAIAFRDRMGAYSQVALLSRVLKQTLSLSYPSNPELERVLTTLEVTRHFADTHLGVLSQARKSLEEILGRGGHSPSLQYGIHFCLVLIGRETGEQELTMKHLDALASLANKHQVFQSTTEQQLAAFALVTFKYEVEFSQSPESLVNFMGNHSSLWNHLNQAVPSQKETLGTVGFLPVLLAAEYWATEVTRRYCDPSLSDQEKSYLSEALKHQGMVLARWRDPDLTSTHSTEELPYLNWEAISGFPYWNLAVASEARRHRNFRVAELMLKGAESECNNVGALFTRTLKEYPRIDVASTTQARVVGDIESEWGRFYLAQYRESGDKSKLKLAYQKLEAARQQQNVTQNVTGMLELTPEFLQALIMLKPENWYADALKVVEDVGQVGAFVGYRPALVVHHHYLSVLKESKGDLEGAVVESQKAVKLLEELVAQYGGLSPAGLRLKELAPGVYEHSTKLLAKSGDVRQAFVTVDRSQQIRSLGQFEPKFGQKSPIAANLAKIRRARGEIAALESSLGGRPHSPEAPENKTKLSAAKTLFLKEVTELSQKHPEFERMLAVRPISFGELQKSIPADTAVVQYFPSADRLYLFVLTSDSLQVRQAEIGREVLKGQISEFRKSIISFETNSELSFSLHKTLIGPVQSDIANKKVLVLVPTGTLTYLPFAALQKEGSYLIESYQIAIVQQSSQLENLSGPPSSREGDMLAVGNPDETLPSSEEEAEEVGSFFAKVKLLLRGEATLSRLLEGLKSPVSYLHMATHGVLDSTDPKASYLVLAGSRLHNYEIAAMKLKGTRLVTLSACQTAIGSRDPGSEVSSLAQAFGFAGATCVVSTLWSIDDAQTKSLMNEFYGRLKAGDSVAAALNQSQLAMLKSPQSRDPFFWAGVQVGGDWR